jgi:hypothetical protein
VTWMPACAGVSSPHVWVRFGYGAVNDTRVSTQRENRVMNVDRNKHRLASERASFHSIMQEFENSATSRRVWVVSSINNWLKVPLDCAWCNDYGMLAIGEDWFELLYAKSKMLRN